MALRALEGLRGCDGLRTLLSNGLLAKVHLELPKEHCRSDHRLRCALGLAAKCGKADRLPFSVNVDVEHAEATIAADRENILRLIRQDLGASKLNAVIAKAMTGALTDAGKRESMVGASSKPRGGDLK